MKIEELIEQMKEVKQNNPSLEVSDVLRLFQIQATMEQTAQMRVSNGR